MTVDVEGERAVGIGGDPDHRFTQGFLCAKVNQYLDRVYSPERVLYPMRRVGKKGEGRFERISWDAALDIAAKRLRRGRRGSRAAGDPALLVRRQHGPARQRQHGPPLLPPARREPPRPDDLRERGRPRLQGRPAARRSATTPRRWWRRGCIVAWGGNIVSSNVHLWPFVEEARRRGARLVTIDPYRSRTAEKSDQHIALYPGTDAALALGMMHVIFRDGLEDRDWLERYSLGHAELRARAREWTPRESAAATGLRADEIERLRARVRDHAAVGDPHQLRAQPPRGRRDGGAHDRLPARASSAPGARWAAARCCPPRAPSP